MKNIIKALSSLAILSMISVPCEKEDVFATGVDQICDNGKVMPSSDHIYG